MSSRLDRVLPDFTVFGDRAPQLALADVDELRGRDELEPLVDDGETPARYLGSRTWNPSPQALRRVADLADRIEQDLRAGTGRFAFIHNADEVGTIDAPCQSVIAGEQTVERGGPR